MDDRFKVIKFNFGYKYKCAMLISTPLIDVTRTNTYRMTHVADKKMWSMPFPIFPTLAIGHNAGQILNTSYYLPKKSRRLGDYDSIKSMTAIRDEVVYMHIVPDVNSSIFEVNANMFTFICNINTKVIASYFISAKGSSACARIDTGNKTIIVTSLVGHARKTSCAVYKSSDKYCRLIIIKKYACIEILAQESMAGVKTDDDISERKKGKHYTTTSIGKAKELLVIPLIIGRNSSGDTTFCVCSPQNYQKLNDSNYIAGVFQFIHHFDADSFGEFLVGTTRLLLLCEHDKQKISGPVVARYNTHKLSSIMGSGNGIFNSYSLQIINSDDHSFIKQ